MKKKDRGMRFRMGKEDADIENALHDLGPREMSAFVKAAIRAKIGIPTDSSRLEQVLAAVQRIEAKLSIDISD